jgi:hypothetical protein
MKDSLKEFSTTFVIEGFKSKYSKVNEKLISSQIEKDWKFLSKHNKLTVHNYFCHPFNYHQHQDWIQDHCNGTFFKLQKSNLVPLKTPQACVLNKKYYSIRRNHLHQSNSFLSPDAVLIYFLKGEGRIFYDYYHYKKDLNRWKNTYKPGQFYIMSSDINYYIENKNNSIFLIYECRKVL